MARDRRVCRWGLDWYPDILDTFSFQLQVEITFPESTQPTIHYGTQLLFSVLLYPHHDFRRPSSGFSNCLRASATAILDQLLHNYYFLWKTRSRPFHIESLYATQEGCFFTIYSCTLQLQLTSLRHR
jgi:hypothetical protein